MSTLNRVCAVLFLASIAACKQQPAAQIPLSEDALCARDLTKFVQFRDPDSVKINSVKPNELRPGRYWLSVSAKNALGGYSFPATCSCGVVEGAVKDIQCSG